MHGRGEARLQRAMPARKGSQNVPRTTCTVDEPVADLETGIDGFGCFFAGVFPSAHAHLGQLVTVPEGQCWIERCHRGEGVGLC